MKPMEILLEQMSRLGLPLSLSQGEKFNSYSSFLVEYNRMVNLTAITDPQEIAVKHFLDSLMPCGLFAVPQGASLIDVGTGAGFPGVPLKIARPDLAVTLLDSLQKRLVFLSKLCEKLDTPCALVHMRAENAGADPALRERFDVAVSRAVAHLSVLCEYCLPLVAIGGHMLALKGPDCAQEVAQAEIAVALLGGELSQTVAYELPGYGKRTLVIIKKISHTPPKYPRQRVNLTKNPLF
jgi:16S rRNA (guanine527-N7)-methyltransferase